MGAYTPPAAAMAALAPDLAPQQPQQAPLTQPPVPAWFDYSKNFQPDLPDEAYDAAREQFYQHYTGPFLMQHGYGFDSGRDEFMKSTERPGKSAMPRTSLMAREAGAAFSAPFLGQEEAEQAMKVPQAREEAQRQGITTWPYEWAGSIAGQAPYWEIGMGVAGLAGEGLKAGVTAQKFLNTAAGSIIQGSYDAAKAPDNRMIEGLEGAATGGAFAGAKEGLGPLARFLKGQFADSITDGEASAAASVARGVATPDEQDAAVNVAQQPHSDDVVKQYVQQTQAETKAAGVPKLLQDEPQPKPGRVKVQFTGSDGVPYKLGGIAGMSLSEGGPTSSYNIVQRMVSHLQRGGSLDGVIGDQTSVERFMAVMEAANEIVKLPGYEPAAAIDEAQKMAAEQQMPYEEALRKVASTPQKQDVVEAISDKLEAKTADYDKYLTDETDEPAPEATAPKSPLGGLWPPALKQVQRALPMPTSEMPAPEPPAPEQWAGRVRGSAQMPLDEHGIAEIDAIGREFGQQTDADGRYAGLDALFSDSSTRAKQTMGILAAHNPLAGIQDITDQLDTTGRGALEGLEHGPIVDAAERALALDTPGIPMPDGSPYQTKPSESFDQAAYRSNAYLRDVVIPYAQEHPYYKVGVVTHGSNIGFAHGWAAEGMPSDMSFDHNIAYDMHEPPGAVYHMDPQTGEMSDAAGDYSRNGIYLIRHGETPWNAQDLPATFKEGPLVNRISASDDIMEGTRGMAVAPSAGEKPNMLINRDTADRSTLVHEWGHNLITLNRMRGLVREATTRDDGEQLVHDVFNGNSFSDENRAAYTPTPSVIPEEILMYTNQAIHTGDQQLLDEFGRDDTDKEHILQWATRVNNELLDHLAEQPDSMAKRRFERQLGAIVTRGTRQMSDLRSAWDNAPGEVGLEDGQYTYRDYDRVERFPTRDALSRFMETMFGKPITAPELVDLDSVPDGIPRYARDIQANNNMRAPLQGDPPPPELSNNPTPRAGLLLGSFFTRPFLSWLSSAAERFDRPQLYAAGKVLDEATGNMDVAMAPYVKVLKDNLWSMGDSRQDAMYKFMEAEPKDKQFVAQELGITSEEMQKLKTLDDEFIQPLKSATGTSLTDYVQNIVPMVRNARYDLDALYPKDRTHGFWAQAMIDGALDPRDTNLTRVAATYVRRAMQRQFLDGPLKDWQKVVNEKTPDGDSYYGALRPLLDRHGQYVKGIPDWSQKLVMGAIEGATEVINNGIDAVNSKLPASMQIPNLDAGPHDILSKWLTFSYAGGLALRLAVPTRDALQIFLTTYPLLGNYTWTGMRRAFSIIKEGTGADAWQTAEKYGALITRNRLGEMYAGGASEDSGLGGRMQEAAEKILQPIRWSHNSNRVVAFWGHVAKGEDALADLQGGGTIGDFTRDSGLWFLPKAQQTRYAAELMKSTTPEASNDIIKRMASDLVDSTQWNYNRGAMPGIYKYQLGRLFGQYGSWPLNYIEYARKMVGSAVTGDNKAEAFKTLSRLVVAHGAVLSAAQAAGIDAGHWVFTQPMAYGGGPVMNAITNIPGSMDFESRRGEEARGELEHLVWPDMLPGGEEAHAIWQAATSSDRNVLIRMMGFQPMGPHEAEKGMHQFVP
jgi:broad specificity phosphatase PhoE